MITASVVSHQHGAQVCSVVRSLLEIAEISSVILTVNTPEALELPDDPRLTVLENREPAGFGRNHNQAFERCQTPLYCVVNPDISVQAGPFRLLCEMFHRYHADIVAPQVLAPDGHAEDNLRRFPTLFGLMRKVFGLYSGTYPSSTRQGPFHPEWAAGMFLLFKSDAYSALGGFDEKFFLYYEDVDLCARAWKRGLKLIACPQATVIHDARRASHRDLRHMRWHLSSMARYFRKHWGRLPSVRTEAT